MIEEPTHILIVSDDETEFVKIEEPKRCGDCEDAHYSDEWRKEDVGFCTKFGIKVTVEGRCKV